MAQNSHAGPPANCVANPARNNPRAATAHRTELTDHRLVNPNGVGWAADACPVGTVAVVLEASSETRIMTTSKHVELYMYVIGRTAMLQLTAWGTESTAG
ncbi:putative 3-amino-2,3-dideoxy-scyllo-inositol 1-d ehydrogenase [Mycolicibacterium novocastrense]|uniref:3-amino-2,3-dideoxy-scyllo-inositol 1-d ehydrogenase n=1 Tax=Mycolicibacterium novocastrense TaxID=59813 RepID=A0ABQ0KFN8_MYCNV|nr:putative 3-amino-2,3-dideoxy-scyllo-inositol 1-d ehydrogenase [Mycolicibacterium novocastrense]